MFLDFLLIGLKLSLFFNKQIKILFGQCLGSYFGSIVEDGTLALHKTEEGVHKRRAWFSVYNLQYAVIKSQVGGAALMILCDYPEKCSKL